jgi:hypothetical protein
MARAVMVAVLLFLATVSAAGAWAVRRGR